MVMGSSSMRVCKFTEHGRLSSHNACVNQYTKDTSGAKTGLVRGLERHIPVTRAQDIVCCLIVTIYSAVYLNLAFSSVPGLCEMQSLNGLEMGNGKYQNHEFWDVIIVLIAAYYRSVLLEKNLRSLVLVGISIIMDGSGRRLLVPVFSNSHRITQS